MAVAQEAPKTPVLIVLPDVQAPTQSRSESLKINDSDFTPNYGITIDTVNPQSLVAAARAWKPFLYKSPSFSLHLNNLKKIGVLDPETQSDTIKKAQPYTSLRREVRAALTQKRAEEKRREAVTDTEVVQETEDQIDQIYRGRAGIIDSGKKQQARERFTSVIRGKEAFNALVEHNLLFVAHIVARDFRRMAIGGEDLVQIGSISLIKGFEGYDPVKHSEVAPLTFVGNEIRWNLIAAIEEEMGQLGGVHPTGVKQILNLRREVGQLLGNNESQVRIEDLIGKKPRRKDERADWEDRKQKVISAWENRRRIFRDEILSTEDLKAQELQEGEDGLPVPHVLKDPLTPTEEVDEGIDRERIAGTVHQAIAALPAEEANAVKLFFLESNQDLTLNEIAAQLGVPPATALKQRDNGLRMLSHSKPLIDLLEKPSEKAVKKPRLLDPKDDPLYDENEYTVELPTPRKHRKTS